MAGKIKLDDKTGKVISAELDVDYAGFLGGAAADLEKHRRIAAKIERALKMLGISNRELKEADHKKLAAAPNAAALIKDFQAAQFEVTTAHLAYDSTEHDAAESKARSALFKEAAATTAARMADIEKQILDLKAELGKLEGQKKDLIAQITKATEPRRNEFKKSFEVLQKAAKALSVDCSRPNWDFNLTLSKYMKK